MNTGKENLAQRLKFLQTQLAHAPMPSITSKRRQLPSIEEAWNLPISAEMSSRQQQTAQNNQQRPYARNYNQVRYVNKIFYMIGWHIICSWDFFLFNCFLLHSHPNTHECRIYLYIYIFGQFNIIFFSIS